MTTIRQPSRTASRLLALLAGSLLVLGLAACGSSGDSGSSSGGGGGDLPPGDVVLTADNIAWDTDSLEAPADTDFTIVIDNKDEGVQHNLDIKETEFGLVTSRPACPPGSCQIQPPRHGSTTSSAISTQHGRRASPSRKAPARNPRGRVGVTLVRSLVG